VRANVASPSLTGKTHPALTEPASDPPPTQRTDPYDKRRDRPVRDAEATEPECSDVHTPTRAASTSEPQHQGDPRVDPGKATPHELIRRERRRAGG